MIRATIHGDLVMIQGGSIEEIEQELNKPAYRPTKEEIDRQRKKLYQLWEETIWKVEN